MIEEMLIGLLRRRCWLTGFGAATLLVGLLVLAGSAEAAFPGRDGLLAVQPLQGAGIVLVNAYGGGETRVCAGSETAAQACSVARPRWSPDGRTLVTEEISSVFGTSFVVIYPDGGCLDCQPVPGDNAAFTSNPTLLTAVYEQQAPKRGLFEYGSDGLLKQTVLSSGVSDAVWSSTGKLAVVRGAWIWVGSPGTLRRLARGSAPSWSPDGKQVALERNGWLLTRRVATRSGQRLVRGSAPAWSPNGKWLAFFGTHDRLSIVRASGGRVRRLGDLKGRTVDWQPLPAKPPAACMTPPGSTVAASGDSGIITADSAPLPPFGSYTFTAGAYMGCLSADGRPRLLARYDIQNIDSETSASEAVVAGPYAAFVVNQLDIHYGGNTNKVEVFDLRTGAMVPDRGGESDGCPGSCSIDRPVLGSDGVSAAHTLVPVGSCNCTDEQIQASDSTGVHTLDSVSTPQGSVPALTNLTLTGDTLTWEHNGTPQSAQLQP
jgi:hypothetical protein